MKKLFIPSLLVCIIASILLSSCGSSNSIIKRRYSKGHFVSHTKNRHTDANRHEKTALAKADKPVIVNVPAENENTAAENKATIAAKSPVVTASNKVVSHKVKNNQAPPSVSNPVSENYSQAAELSAKRSFKAIDNKVIQKHAADSDDGLSLLWIVIVVLLVLFFLGLIGDVLGGLIYILLVIALVLLILWLLRIL